MGVFRLVFLLPQKQVEAVDGGLTNAAHGAAAVQDGDDFLHGVDVFWVGIDERRVRLAMATNYLIIVNGLRALRNWCNFEGIQHKYRRVKKYA